MMDEFLAILFFTVVTVLLVVGVAFGLTAAATPMRVSDAALRDTIFSVEKTNNGYYRIYMTHDDVAGYCTGDVEIGQTAEYLLDNHDGEVVIEFRDIKYLGDDESALLASSKCGSVSEGGKMFVIVSIAAVDKR